MSQLNLDLLVRAHTEANVEQVTLAFVINYYSFAFIARRHHFDFLAGCYELPQGVMKDKESVLAATKRILQTHFGVELLSIDQYLHTFLYQSGNKKKCRAFVFSVKVVNPRGIKLDRNDHGVWMQMSELKSWPIMTHYMEALVNFWVGESYSSMIGNTLVEQAKRDDIWRHKVRVVLHYRGQILLLKRARRNRNWPLYYELPGKDVGFNQEIDSAIIQSVTEQTGMPPARITRYLGNYDYIGPDKVPVREFIFAAFAQGEQVKISEHAYYVWAEKLPMASVFTTPCVEVAFALYQDKFFIGLPEQVEGLPTVYFDPLDNPERHELMRYADAMSDLERLGILDVALLRGKVLRKRWIPQALHDELGL